MTVTPEDRPRDWNSHRAGQGHIVGPNRGCEGVGSMSVASAANYLLVHGAWHGGWYWRRVADLLVAAGHRVFAPTLTGLSDRRHLLTPQTDVNTHIEDVAELIEAEELANVVLVGHSYGGVVITGVAARMPERLKQLVYLDGVLAEDGQSWSSVHSPESVASRAKAAIESSGGLTMPTPSAAVLGLTDPDDQAWVERRLTPQPYSTFVQKMNRGGPLGNGVPRLYIDCTEPASGGLAPMKEKYRGQPGWPFVEIRTGHDAAVSAPRAVTEILLGLA